MSEKLNKWFELNQLRIQGKQVNGPANAPVIDRVEQELYEDAETRANLYMERKRRVMGGIIRPAVDLTHYDMVDGKEVKR